VKLLTNAEVAEMLRTPEATLRYWRHIGQGPASIKAGRRVLYREADVERWVEERYAAEAQRAERDGAPAA
jgi:DNA-binding transcriptional MerR regulator